MDFPTVYTVAEAAALAKVKPATIISWMNRGMLQRTKIGDRLLVRAEALAAMLYDVPKTGR